MELENKPIFNRKIGIRGGSLAVSLPSELARFLEIKNGDTASIIADTGKHGKYIAIWKQDNQE